MSDHHSNLQRGFNRLGAATVVAKVVDLGATVTVLWFLTQEQVGIASLVWAIAVILEAAEGLGTGVAIVQARSVTRVQLDSLYWLSIAVAVLSGALLLLAGPLLGHLFDIPGMSYYLLPVVAKLLFVGAAVVPFQLLNRELKYERIAVINVCATIGAAATRVVVAALGGGAWAIILGYSAYGLFALIGAQIANPFLPRLHFQRRAIGALVRFGVQATAADGLQQIFRNIDYLLIGWFYGPAPVAIYRVAFEIAMQPAAAIGDLVNRTALPVFAKFAASRHRVGESLAWAVGRISALLGPLVAALILIAGPLTGAIHAAGGKSYAAAALPLKFLAVAAILRSVYELIYPLSLGTGRPGVALRLSATTLVMLTLGIVAVGLLCDARQGVVAISAVWLAIYPIMILWAASIVLKVYRLDLRALVRPLVPALAATVFVALAIDVAGRILVDAELQARVGFALLALGVAYGALFLYGRRRTTNAQG